VCSSDLRVEGWSECHSHPYKNFISSNMVNLLLNNISKKQISSFLNKFADKIFNNENLLFTITPLVFLNNKNLFISHVDDKFNNNLDRVNLLTISNTESKLPYYYCILSNTINNIYCIEKYLCSFKISNINKVKIYLDNNIYSSIDINQFIEQNYNFICEVTKLQDLIDDFVFNYDYIVKNKNNFYFDANNQFLLIKQDVILKNINKKVYLYFYNDNIYFNNDIISFINDLNHVNYKKIDIFNNQNSYKDLYSCIDSGNSNNYRSSTDLNSYKIRLKNILSNFKCLLSINDINIDEIVDIYKINNIITYEFKNIYNLDDIKNLSINNADLINSRLFIQFIAFILVSYVNKTIKSNKNLSRLTTREVFDRLRPAAQFEATEGYGRLYSGVGQKAKEILALFDLKWPPG
jgi:hypothetical protein